MSRAGIHKIAEVAGVSIGTVDRALHSRPGISAATRQRILRVAKRLNYTPHPAARALSIGRAHLRIGVCIPKEIHFYYDHMRAGIFEEAERAGGHVLEIVYRPVPALGESEEKQMSVLLASKVNGLILTPGNPRIVTPLINRAEAANIRVICTTTDAPRSRRSSVVAVDPGLSGRLAAELMSKFVPPGSETAVMTGMLSTEEHRQKAEGFRSGFEKDCPGGRVVAVVEAHESAQESFKKTLALLGEHPRIAGIYVSTVNCLPVCRALRRRNLAGKVRLITTDLFPQMIPHLERSTIHASVYQHPYLQGQTAVRMLLDSLTKGTPIPQAFYINPGVVLHSNLNLFREASLSANGKRPRS